MILRMITAGEQTGKIDNMLERVSDFLDEEIETTLAPMDLLRAAKQIESDMGRQRTRRWGPRLIDIDLLTHGDTRVATRELTLPHPFILERPFVYEPLGELAPGVLEALRRDAALPV